MMTFRVSVNGELAAVGNGGNLGTLIASVSAFGAASTASAVHLDFRGVVEGSGGTVEWIRSRVLAPGDTVTIELCDGPPVALVPNEADPDAERTYFELSRDAYFRLKQKYEP